MLVLFDIVIACSLGSCVVETEMEVIVGSTVKKAVEVVGTLKPGNIIISFHFQTFLTLNVKEICLEKRLTSLVVQQQAQSWLVLKVLKYTFLTEVKCSFCCFRCVHQFLGHLERLFGVQPELAGPFYKVFVCLFVRFCYFSKGFG